jgi:RNA polymerase sigma-70 factor (ECF subfamily)
MEHAAPRDEQGRRQAFDRYVVPELGVLLHVQEPDLHGSGRKDRAQETLLRAYQGIGRFDGTHTRAWLFTIMCNAQVNRVRRKRPELLDDAEDAAAVVQEYGAPPPEDAAEARAFDEAMADAVQQLPASRRRAVRTLDHIRGRVEMRTCDEVGRILQTYLDGERDEAGVAKVTAHFEHCRRCGMVADTYERIKESLARVAQQGLIHLSIEQLRRFADTLRT